MKGDFTRWTFDPSNRYSSVRLQQGRVLLDADWNEQLDIMAHREQYANKEIIGLHGVPDLKSFEVDFPEDDNEHIKLGAGRCYVDGVLCEKIGEELQQISTVPGLEEPSNNDYLVYLEVWQHHITAIEDQNLLELALGGPDTTTRTETYWQLKALKLEDKGKWRQEWQTLRDDKHKKGKLKVKSGKGLPNDLYRVEIHEVGDTVENTTFKWARNNASMAAKVLEIKDKKVKIEKNNQIQFQQEQGKETWIEITDQERVKAGEPGLFLKVDNVGEDNTLLTISDDNWTEQILELNPISNNQITTVRIWEANAREIKLNTEETQTGFIELEKGLQVNFVHLNLKDDQKKPYSGKYRTGDYWLIPTRSQQEVVWPADDKEPDGIVYHYCPLAIVNYHDKQWKVLQDCREIFPALTEMARETALNNGSKGKKLSIGVHSYNDARRDGKETDHPNDQLDIQGGKQLTLNAGYWKDELEEKAPDAEDQAISFSICEQEVMRLTKDQLSITGNKDLIVEGTSWLKGVVSIGTEDTDKGIGLKVKPELSIEAGKQGQVVGLKLEPILTANNKNDELTGLHICPQFKQQNNPGNFKKYGLIVESGDIAIGKKALEEEDTRRNSNIWTGVALQPEINAKNEKDKLVGLYIKPQFDNNSQEDVEHYGLIVNKGKVGIGEQLTVRDNISIGVDVSSSVSAQNDGDELVGLYIKPSFDDNSKSNVKHYGLIVEDARVAFGPKITVKEKDEYLVDIGKETYLDEKGDRITKQRLKVAGDLEVYGQVTYHAKKGDPGNVELGQQNQDKLLIHGKLETKHTSGKLKVISPLEIQLEEGDTQDFLSLFAANDTDTVNGRIVWKKGTVTQEGIDQAAEKDDTKKYVEQAQEAAAISYYLQEGEGENSSSGELRFSTGKNGTLADWMVITADGNVRIGSPQPTDIIVEGITIPANPGENQLKVTGTTELDTLVVNTSLQVKAAITNLNSLNLTGSGTQDKPTLKIPQGTVCIGADKIPPIEEINNKDIKFYVTGKSNEYVSFKDIDFTVYGGSTDVDKLTVTPSLTSSKKDEKLVAATINPTFTVNHSNVKTLGLLVESGDVQIGGVPLSGEKAVEPTLKVLPNLTGTSNATEITPTLRSNGQNQTLTAMKIAPTFSGNHSNVKKFGLLVESGDVQVGGDSNIALKVNQENKAVGIGGESESGYKLAVTGDTKLTGKLKVVPVNLTGASKAVEIKPAFTGTGIQTAVHIEPTFDGNGDPKFGLHVVRENVALCSTSGGVAIGSDDPTGHKLRVTDGSMCLDGTLTGTDNVLVATEIQPTLMANQDDQTLTAVKINPSFSGDHTGIKKLGLLVESGDVQVGGDSNIALKVNQETQGVGIGGESLENYKLAVTGDTKLTGKLEVEARLKSSRSDDVLTALKINPTFTATHENVQQLGLVVETGDVKITSGSLAIESIINDPIPMSPSDKAPLHVYKYDGTNNNLLEIARFERVCDDASGQAQAEGGSIGLYLYDNNQNGGSTPSRIQGARISWRFDNADNDEKSGRLGFWTSQVSSGGVSELVERMTITKDGVVGIGNTSPDSSDSVKLDVDGKIRTTDGVLTTSDATLKENVKPLKNGLKKILGLRGVSYQWKDDQNATGETQIGLVAQEVEEVFPELVSTDSQGMKSLSYSKLIAPLIEAIKEQNNKISELAKQVKQQQTKITQLQALNKE
ncbi:DUF6519 domain-containing protein [Moorena sp. SIO4G3]|uniref:DUF6519 domain-containing protein n=1 Tax=Moorena sp. SIO4G3 TaxID=2607821 RepID=UPI0014291A8C|nr:DUF6519 domain-containing protein [Moorena sp. SIO4G3]NEO78352.1 tail fiber domain-containing protein [Moorena sp. SIO4G3]